ncbi:MAG TPA: plastocyanin/azurin family copper-binding protein, partial [Chloroflexia bacterium]|nr:plastocyanin/azurin family copper-binding protein [Chloroflexia bacterium]
MLFRPGSQGDARAAGWRALILLLCLSVVLAACGDQPPTATPVAAPGATGVAPGAASAVSIDAVNFKFAPAEITIPAGTTVTWTNKDPAKHTITADNGSFDSGSLD